MVQQVLQANRKLTPSAAAERVAKYGYSPRTLRNAYTKLEKMFQNDPELRRLAGDMLEAHIRIERDLAGLKPFSLYRREIIDAIYDPKMSNDDVRALFSKYAPGWDGK
jgi:hypothetical protein